MHKFPLTQLKKGSKAKVVELCGGHQFIRRLSTLGLRVGGSIIKVSAFALRGPVTIRVGSTTIALGHGMAEKIVVATSVEAVVNPVAKHSQA